MMNRMPERVPISLEGYRAKIAAIVKETVGRPWRGNVTAQLGGGVRFPEELEAEREELRADVARRAGTKKRVGAI